MANRGTHESLFIHSKFLIAKNRKKWEKNPIERGQWDLIEGNGLNNLLLKNEIQYTSCMCLCMILLFFFSFAAVVSDSRSHSISRTNSWWIIFIDTMKVLNMQNADEKHQNNNSNNTIGTTIEGKPWADSKLMCVWLRQGRARER